MHFEIKSFLFPLFIFLLSEILIFIVVPMEFKTETVVFNYQTMEDEYLKEATLTPVIIQNLVVFAIIIWLVWPKDAEETTILRTAKDILHDRYAEPQLAAYDVDSRTEPLHEETLGESIYGTEILFIVENENKEEVACKAIANDNYRTTEVRQKKKSPILNITRFVGSVEDLKKDWKLIRRATDERIVERARKIVKKKPHIEKYVDDLEEEEEAFE